MGYLRELIALEARYKRCRAAWRTHLDNTQRVIIEAINSTRQRDKAVVLGAGILSDLPIKTLSDSFQIVELVDVCFLRQTRKYVRPYSNTILRTCDITDIAQSLYDWAQQDTNVAATPAPGIPDNFDLKNTDLLISANVVSQLPLIPIDFLRLHASHIEDESITAFARKIIENHVALLRSSSGTVCLITETERQFCNGDRVLETEDPLFGYPLNMDGDLWMWDLAPRGEESTEYAIRNRIVGTYW